MAIKTSEDVIVSKVGRELYEKFFRNYTRKQWDLDPSELDAAVTARVPVRTNNDDRYFTDSYQAMPLHGYTRLFEKMLSHPNIKVMLNADYREVQKAIPHDEVDLHGTGGRILRLSLRPAAVPIARLQVRDDQQGMASVRSLSSTIRTITCIRASPSSSISPARSITRRRSSTSIRKRQATPTTRSRAARTRNSTASTRCWPPRPTGVHFVGRLATYKYYNMDQVVAQALTLYAKLTSQSRQEALAHGA